MSTVQHQMPAKAGQVAAGRGEALARTTSDETNLPRQGSEGAGRDLLWQALARDNMQRAWKRVKANKGAAGVDGLDIAQTGEHLKHAWPTIRQQLMEGRALQLKQWRRGKTIYRELLRLGATPHVAQSVAALSRRWWHNSLSGVHGVLTVAYYDRLGVPRPS
jgi:hypothetical protein